jgi:hypothetical protein
MRGGIGDSYNGVRRVCRRDEIQSHERAQVTAKRRKPFAANSATIKALESEGWTCGLVEQRIPHCFITRDLFGFADIVAISPSRGFLAVQATGGGNGPARVRKIKAEPRAAIWLATGGRIQVWDWRKTKASASRLPHVTEVTKA